MNTGEKLPPGQKNSRSRPVERASIGSLGESEKRPTRFTQRPTTTAKRLLPRMKRLAGRQTELNFVLIHMANLARREVTIRERRVYRDWPRAHGWNIEDASSHEQHDRERLSSVQLSSGLLGSHHRGSTAGTNQFRSFTFSRQTTPSTNERAGLLKISSSSRSLSPLSSRAVLWIPLRSSPSFRRPDLTGLLHRARHRKLRVESKLGFTRVQNVENRNRSFGDTDNELTVVSEPWFDSRVQWFEGLVQDWPLHGFIWSSISRAITPNGCCE